MHAMFVPQNVSMDVEQGVIVHVLEDVMGIVPADVANAMEAVVIHVKISARAALVVLDAVVRVVESVVVPVEMNVHQRVVPNAYIAAPVYV